MGTTTERFEQYVSLISQQLGHADRVDPFRGYCTGLLLPVQRKSVEPMAAHLAPGGTAILSGLLHTQARGVVVAHLRCGLHQEASIQEDLWTTLILRRKAGPADLNGPPPDQQAPDQ